MRREILVVAAFFLHVSRDIQRSFKDEQQRAGIGDRGITCRRSLRQLGRGGEESKGGIQAAERMGKGSPPLVFIDKELRVGLGF